MPESRTALLPLAALASGLALTAVAALGGVATGQLAPGGQRQFHHELQSPQRLAHDFGQSREVITRCEEHIGVVLAETLVDVGLHGGGRGKLHSGNWSTAYPQAQAARLPDQ